MPGGQEDHEDSLYQLGFFHNSLYSPKGRPPCRTPASQNLSEEILNTIFFTDEATEKHPERNDSLFPIPFTGLILGL